MGEDRLSKMKLLSIFLAVAASRVIEGSGDSEEPQSVWAPIRIKSAAQINAAFQMSLEKTRIQHEQRMAKTRSDYEAFKARMANLREKESVKAIEAAVKSDLETGLKTAQEKLGTKAEELEASYPMEPIARTGLTLMNGLIDDIIVSFN